MPIAEGWRRDWRQAWAGLRRSPGLAIAAILTLALGLGANFALFSALDAVLWRSLPVPRPRQIYLLDRNDHDARFSYPLIQDLRRALGTDAWLAAMTPQPYSFSAPGQGIANDQVRGQLVSGNFFTVLGVRSWRGRLLDPADNAPPAGRAVAVLSYAFWLARYHGAGALGTTLVLNRQPVEVVGIAPPRFHGVTRGDAPEVWMPLRLQPRLGYFINASLDSDRGAVEPRAAWAAQAGISWLIVLARIPAAGNLPALTARSTVVQQRDLAPYLSRIETARKRARFAGERIVFRPSAEGLNQLAARMARPLWVLAAMVGLALLVACLNIAMLLLARGAGRRREHAIRIALGASRGALLRQALVEGTVLALLGGAGGLLLAYWGRAALLGLLGVANAPAVLAGGEGAVVAFAAALSLAAGIALSLAPGWRAGRVAPLPALQSRQVSGERRRPRGALVACQVAISLVLLIGAGLLAHSLIALTRVNPGFATQGVLLARIDPRAAGYQPAQLPALYRRLVARVNALPGVESSGLAMCGSYCQFTGTTDAMTESGLRRGLEIRGDLIGAGYLHARGLRIVRGRDFTAADAAGAPLVAIVNQTFARRYLAGLDPLRQRLVAWNSGGSYAAIVGVVADARLAGLRAPPPPFVFYPLAQTPDYVMSLAVRTRGATALPAPALRATLAQVAPAMPVGGVVTAKARLADSWSDAAALAKLSGGVALLALALACLGLYGVAAYGVARRVPEIGMRMALGARRGQVFALIWSETMRATLVGAVAGLALAWLFARLARGLLFGVQPLDPAAWVAALTLLLAAASLAALIPAHRASRLAPWAALRRE
ncbi:MAG: ADOP family duplicated permease [Terriglobales bacterium]